MDMFQSLGFSEQDLMLLKLCPLFAALGGFVHAYVLIGDYSKLPKNGRLAKPREALARVAWLTGRLLIAAVAGFVLALYMVGALTDSPTTTARILAFSVLVGYAAPRLWATQESLVNEVLEKKLRSLLEEHGLVAHKSSDGEKAT